MNVDVPLRPCVWTFGSSCVEQVTLKVTADPVSGSSTMHQCFLTH